MTSQDYQNSCSRNIDIDNLVEIIGSLTKDKKDKQDCEG